MSALHLFLAFCSLISCSAKSQLTLESKRGELKLKNFRHLHKHRLNVVPIASFEVGKEMKCTTSCTKSDGCFSFNVKKLTENSFLCELLNTTKSIDAENLTQDDSFTHYHLQDACVPNPCLAGTCETNTEKIGFTCVCPKLLIGRRCGLCEEAGMNFVLGTATEQSSTYLHGAYGYFPSNLAADGNKGDTYRTSLGQPQCALTGGGVIGAWWRADFGKRIPVARIVIIGRADCCRDRMRAINIRVGDSLVDNGLTNPKCGDTHNAEVSPTTLRCTPIMVGRYLVIETLIAECLELCEVEAYCQ